MVDANEYLSGYCERLGKYKDIMLNPDQIDRHLKDEGNWELLSEHDLYATATALGMAAMSLYSIAFSALFRVDQL